MAERIRAPVSPLNEGETTLDRATTHYLARVLRLRPGDRFEAFDPEGAREADATVVRLERDRFVVAIAELRNAARTAPLSVVWIQGLAKGEKCDAIVRDATELGATQLVLTPSARSIATLDPARMHTKRERWKRIADQAARQCGRGDPPAFDRHGSWTEAVASVREPTARFCLYEHATMPLGPPLAHALTSDVPLAFAVGPEGGLTEIEIAWASTRGWNVCSLGPLILRTETVVSAVLGAVLVGALGKPR